MVSIGFRGQRDLVALRLVDPPGIDVFHRSAERIVLQAVPAPPFRAELEGLTSRPKLVVGTRYEPRKDLVPDRVGPQSAGFLDSDWLSAESG